jgi:hypothetical protein
MTTRIIIHNEGPKDVLMSTPGSVDVVIQSNCEASAHVYDGNNVTVSEVKK